MATSTERYARLNARIRDSIENPQHSNALMRCMERGRVKRSEMLQRIEGGALFRNEVRLAKERCIADQDALLERFIANCEKRGTKVFVAKTGAEAIEYVLNLAKERGAETIAKSKSLTTEEIEINDPLIEAGLRVVETDLGELIIQLVNEKPFHLVFPSVHKMTADVAEIFSKETGKDVEPDIPSIMKVVRAYLRPIFLSADIGMTGANIGIAETGTIVIETNEGNGRLVSSIGNCHVCVMGMEKIVDTVEDALLMVMAHPVSASGQFPTTYVTWMSGRSPLGEPNGEPPRESHIVILDNGRTEMRGDDAMREGLHCIRCGACMNVCPTYGVVGGHTFGHSYPGPIGIPWTAQVHGLETAGDFAPLCISCGLCKEICPAQIDMPIMIAEVKQRDAVKHPPPLVNRVMMLADQYAKFGSATAPFSNWGMRSKLMRVLMERMLGLDASRPIPPFARKPLMKRLARRKSPVRNPKGRVALFIDVYANYNVPELGMAAVEHLEALGYEIVVPEQLGSGYPFIAYGDLHRARETAAFNVDRLSRIAGDDCAIVAIEPTAAYCLKVSYPKLLNKSRKSGVVAEHSFELFDFLAEHELRSVTSDALGGKRFGFHVSCHQRPLDSGNSTMDWLRRRGAEIELIETGTCCGMGGTFGMKAGALGAELSRAVGEPLCELFAEAKVEAVVTESSVCAIQLRDGTGLPVYHPLELLSLK
jgi:L-lactate dehydrogenase complex protein LldF